MGLGARNLSWGFVNYKGPDQPAGISLRSLISAFGICLLESIISDIAQGNFNFLASPGWFEPHLVRNPEDRVSHVRPM